MRAGQGSRVPRLTRSDVGKPKVLLVDDHRGILDRVSAMLVNDFDVVGMATDGKQALDVASQVAHDVIVLDINMPGLDGFQTKRALEHAGLRAPVVFLSAFDADDCVSEAFRCGGRGYVLQATARARPRQRTRPGAARTFVRAIAHIVVRTGGRRRARHAAPRQRRVLPRRSCYSL